MALLTAFAQVAGAEPSTEEKLEAAKAEFEQLTREIEAQQQVLNRLSMEAAVIAERWEVANGRWEQITAQLRETLFALAEAQAEYQGLKADLEERAREAYIIGPGSGIEFLLGASSIADLSARMEYVNALSQEDADLATQVQNLRNALAAQKEDQEKLQTKASEGSREGRGRAGPPGREVRRAGGGPRRPEREEGAGAGDREGSREAVRRESSKPSRVWSSMGTRSSRSARSISRGRSTTGSARRATAGVTTRTPATTSSRRRGRRSARRSTATPRRVRTRWVGTR